MPNPKNIFPHFPATQTPCLWENLHGYVHFLNSKLVVAGDGEGGGIRDQWRTGHDGHHGVTLGVLGWRRFRDWGRLCWRQQSRWGILLFFFLFLDIYFIYFMGKRAVLRGTRDRECESKRKRRERIENNKIKVRVC